MPLITVEQAVEAVERCSREMLLGQVEVIVAALRAIQPQEANENHDVDLQQTRHRAHDAEAALGRLREALGSVDQAVRDVTRDVEVASLVPPANASVRSIPVPESELPDVREALREWGEEQERSGSARDMRVLFDRIIEARDRDREREIKEQAAALANQASTMRQLVYETNRLQEVRGRLQSITTAPSVEASTCSGNLATCNCTMCRILRTISYIDGEPVA